MLSNANSSFLPEHINKTDLERRRDVLIQKRLELEKKLLGSIKETQKSGEGIQLKKIANWTLVYS